MSEQVTIVTAFYDIGRSEWEGVKNGTPIPHFIKRDTELYFERFERLTKLDNPIIVYTESRFIPRILAMRSDIKCVSIDDIFVSNKQLLDIIKCTQSDQTFIDFVENPALPEYWSAEYVLLMVMKSLFVTHAVNDSLCPTNTVAWIDFGYARDDVCCPPGMRWKFDTRGRVNIFTLGDHRESSLFDVVRCNKVHVQGCHIVAPARLWSTLMNQMKDALSRLIEFGLIDDDQTLLLMSFRDKPDLFIYNKGNPNDWFNIFREYNHE